ncbi:MAG: hypothetical protein ACM3NH_00045 [Candidatus Saccharibacteria bacterium]
MSLKKTFIVLSLVIVAAAAVASLGWLYYRRQIRTENAAVIPANLTMKKISDNSVVSPVASDDGQSLWFFTDTGRLYRISSVGGFTEFPLPPLTGTFLKAYWSKSDGQDFLAQATQAGRNFLFYYDQSQGKYKPLTGNISDPAWVGNGKQIVFVWKSGDNKTQQLVISGPDGSGYKVLSDLPWPDFDIYPSPTEDLALLIPSHLSGSVNKIYKFSLQDGKYQVLVEDGASTFALWAPDGKSFAYVRDGELMRYDLATGKSADLNAKTGKGKISFDQTGRFLYAAVSGSEGSERFIRIDWASSERTEYYVPKSEIAVADLVFSGGNLYFTDQKNGGLYLVSK